MQIYDASSRSPFQRFIPSMRSAQDASAGGTGTPIYDALYSEYRRLFRTLPGDRSGEEALDFSGFSAWPSDFPPTAGRHRVNGPAELPPGRTDNRMNEH